MSNNVEAVVSNAKFYGVDINVGPLEKAVGLEPKTFGRVFKCIEGYSDREKGGFAGAFQSFMYRVWNAIKSIFGQSDWQLAKKAIWNNLVAKVKKMPITEGQLKELKLGYKDLMFIKRQYNRVFNIAMDTVIHANNRVKLQPGARAALIRYFVMPVIEECSGNDMDLEQNILSTLTEATAQLPVYQSTLNALQGMSPEALINSIS